MSNKSTSPIPPPELAFFVAALSPENVAKAIAKAKAAPAKDWGTLIESMGLEAVAEATDFPNDPPRALAFVLLRLPDGERFELSRKHPIETCILAGLAWLRLHEAGSPNTDAIVSQITAPEVRAAFGWVVENQTAAFMECAGLGSQLN